MMGEGKPGEKGGVLAEQEPVRYLIFDIESVADGALVAKVRYPGESLSAEQAIARYREELLEQRGTDFIPYTFQMPVSVVVAKVSGAFELLDLIALDEPEWRHHIITEHFWRGWQRYQRPTLVSFNGRTFDMPLMELAAFRFGLSIPSWFETKARTYEQPRNRYNSRYHLDLHDLLTNYGASRFNGGLNLAANLLGKPGKIDVQGDMVQDLFDQGKLAEINNYCRCDVLDTYFVFLRSMVLLGDLDLEGEQRIVAQTRTWLEQRASQQVAFSTYLENWGDWHNPW